MNVASGTKPPGPIILVVDDDLTNLRVIFDHLTDSGFKILVAQDGESALERARYARPDLILLDVMMPKVDGFETCRRLKADEALQDIPVIFMTALTESHDKVKGFRLGVVDYITKPLQYEEVVARDHIG
jgi:DNA-binding response OmpR family regulator